MYAKSAERPTVILFTFPTTAFVKIAKKNTSPYLLVDANRSYLCHPFLLAPVSKEITAPLKQGEAFETDYEVCEPIALAGCDSESHPHPPPAFQ